MTITTTKLTSTAGLAAIAAGLIFIVIAAWSFVEIVVGGLLFGIALFRARIVARWAAALLAVGSVVTILVPVLPHAFERLLALPMGVAIAALGCSLWSRHRTVSDQPDIGPRAVQLDPIGTW